MITVLKTSGKYQAVWFASVWTFDTTEEAEAFCEQNTDKEPKKY